MLSRRAALLAAAAASSVFVTPAFSTETKPFTQGDFAAAQKAGKPIFVNQAEALVEALRHKGKPVGYLLFSGEQHGFRQAATIQRCLDAELQFYAIEVFKIGLTF